MDRSRAWIALLSGALALGTCAGCHRVSRAPGAVVDLDTELEGLSGSTLDDVGALWAVPERGGALARIDPTSHAVHVVPLEGAPPDDDLEAIAWLGEGKLVLGTESQRAGRGSDRLLFATVAGGRASIEASAEVSYARWGLRAPANRGVEGLCAAGRALLVATELEERRDGSRWAPLGRLDLRDRTWSAFRVRLSTETGKLSAIDCRPADGGIEAIAVERHFGVARLLRFTVPEDASGGPIEPRVALDLAPRVRPLPNFEGITWRGDGSVALLTDNHYRMPSTEPSRLYFVPAALLEGHARGGAPAQRVK